MLSVLQDLAVLQDHETIKQLGHILKTNVRACTAVGHPFVTQVRVCVCMCVVCACVRACVYACVGRGVLTCLTYHTLLLSPFIHSLGEFIWTC